jgi:uncharacterized LabA/DUF88 family protein
MSTDVTCLVDGFNLYHSLREVRKRGGSDCRWLDIRGLCDSLLHTIGGGAEIVDIQYFSALAHHMEAVRPGTVARHERYLTALRSTGVSIRLGVFKPKDVRYSSPACDVRLRRHEEKETDVAIASAIVETAAAGRRTALALVSGDTDLLPALRTARRVRPGVQLYCLFPPHRANRAFRSVVDADFKINPRKLAEHLLPDPVVGARGQLLACPAEWA